MAARRALSLLAVLSLLCPAPAAAKAMVKAPALGRSPLVAPAGVAPLAIPALESVLAPSLQSVSLVSPSVLPSAAAIVQPVEAAAVAMPVAARAAVPTVKALPAAKAAAPARHSKSEFPARASLVAVAKRVDKAPAKILNLFFDAGISGAQAQAVAVAPAPRSGPARLNAASVSAPAPKKEPRSPQAEPVKKKGRFKMGVLLGAAGASALAVFYGAVSPALAVNATVSIGVAAGALWAARRLGRLITRRGPPLKKRSLGAGAVLGIALASLTLAYPQGLMQAQLKTADAVRWTWEQTAPESWRGGNIDGAMEVITETREIRSLPSDFGSRVALILAENPEGKIVLEKLRDRGGKLRLPDFYVAEVGAGTGARFNALYDAVYINPSYLKSAGVTLGEVRKDPEAADKLMRHIEVTLFHELHHASQFRGRLFVPGMFEKFPSQMHKVLALQTEYETHVTEQRYVHEKLKADPKAPMKYHEVSEYESFLNDIDGFLQGIDDAHAYRWFSDIDSKYYESFLAGERAVHDARAVEGFLNLSRRAADESEWRANYYFDKAAARAAVAGLPAPVKPF